MYYGIDPDLAKHAYEERLRRAEHERRAQEFLAQQPKLQHRVRELLANFLIAFGTRLKMPYQSKFA